MIEVVCNFAEVAEFYGWPRPEPRRSQRARAALGRQPTRQPDALDLGWVEPAPPTATDDDAYMTFMLAGHNGPDIF
jgi:hypothetical protein